MQRSRHKEDEDGFGFADDEWADDAQDPSPSFDRDERGSERSSRRGGASSSNPNPLGLWPLRSDELHELFPLSGTPGQYSYYWGTWDQAVQRFALSLLVTLLATNSSSVVAAGAFTYSVWGPILQSMVRNLGVKKYPYGGYWEARILELSFKGDKGAKAASKNGAGAPFPAPWSFSPKGKGTMSTFILRARGHAPSQSGGEAGPLPQ